MIEECIEEMKDRGHKTIEAVKKEFSRIRTGRASLSILDDVRVEHYGQQMPLNQLANLSVPEARLIVLSPWDPTAMPAIEKALQKANLGVSVNSDGKVVRVIFPELNEDRRKEFVKMAHGKAEEGRVAIRNIRRDANDKLKGMLKDHEIGEDEEHRAVEKIQKLTDEMIQQVNQHLEAKEKEIMEI